MKYILAVDDEPVNLDIIEEILGDDFEVKCVESGEACLESLKERIPDILLLDFAMPRMDGMAVLKQVRANPATANLVVIMLSGYAMADRIQYAIEEGASEYITKPFMPNELLEKLHQYL